MRHDDKQWVEEVRAGRTESFRNLVERHSAAVFRIARSVARQNADAEDLAQEAFVAAFRHLDRLRDPNRFRAFLLAIASRKATDFIRRRQRRAPFLPLLEEPAAERDGPPTETTARLDVVRRVVDQLADDARLVFALRHHEGLSCVQIAKFLDVPEGTIYSRLSRIHARIRKAAEVTDS